MVKLIVGRKGSGKTKRMVDELNQLSAEGKLAVCIEPERRLNHDVKPDIRLIDCTEYPLHSFGELKGFVLGLCSMNYDLDALYIDSLFKLVGSRDQAELEDFLKSLDSFLKTREHDLVCHLMLSADPEELSEGVRKFL